MRDPKEKKFAGLPFSIGCVSQSSVEVADDDLHGRTQREPNGYPSPKGAGLDEMGGGGGSKPSAARNPLGFGRLVPLQRLIRGFKGLSQRFSFKEGEDDDDDDQTVEMEIGFPTDVEHVGHIGWDGTASSLAKIKGAGDAPATAAAVAVSDLSSSPSSSHLYSFHSVYLRQFELAMAAHADPSHHLELP